MTVFPECGINEVGWGVQGGRAGADQSCLSTTLSPTGTARWCMRNMGDAYSFHISFLLPAGYPKLEAKPRSPCSAVPYGAIFQGFALLLFNVFSFLASSDNKFCDYNYVFYFWTILIPVLWEILNNNYYLLWTMWKILFFKNIYYIFLSKLNCLSGKAVLSSKYICIPSL